MLKVMLLLVLVSEDISCRWSVCVSPPLDKMDMRTAGDKRELKRGSL